MATSGFEMLRQNANVGRVRLVPSAISYGPDGPREHDDTWLPALSGDGSVRLQNCTTGHVVDVSANDILAAATDDSAPRCGLAYLRVKLRRRLGLQGRRAWWLSSHRRRPEFQR